MNDNKTRKTKLHQVFKHFLFLLLITLLNSCGINKETLGLRHEKGSWELKFVPIRGGFDVPRETLSLNWRIPHNAIDIPQRDTTNPKEPVVIRYHGVSRATVQEVYDKLKQDFRLEGLAMRQLYSGEAQ